MDCEKVIPPYHKNPRFVPEDAANCVRSPMPDLAEFCGREVLVHGDSLANEVLELERRYATRTSYLVASTQCDRRSNDANESIRSHRHRAKTAPTEQSIGFPCYTSFVRGSGSGLCNGRLASSLLNRIEVEKTDVWSVLTTSSLDSYGVPCRIVDGFAL